MPENSFDARAELDIGGRSYEIYRLDALQSKYDVARLPFSLKVLLENVLRNEDGVGVRKEDVEAIATWDHMAEPSKEIAFTPARVVMQDFTGVPAVVDLAAMRDAMADLGGDPAKINPLRARRAGDRPLGPGRRLRHARRLPRQRRARVRAQPRALRVPALGPGRVRGLQGRPARDGDRPPGQPRVPGARRVRRRRHAVPRHAGRDRLAHHDDQRARRARLGRGRDRGRGVDARPADVDARAARGRLPALGRAAGGIDGDRPRAHRHPDAARARRGRQVRRVLRPGRAEPAARRPRDDRQHEPGVRLDVRDVPDRRRDAALPRVLRPPAGADRAGRGVRARAGSVARLRLGGADLLGDPGARPRRRRAVAGGPEAPAGPRVADGVEGVVPDGAGRVHPGGRRVRRAARGHLPGLGSDRAAGAQDAARAPGRGRGRGHRRGAGGRPRVRQRAGHARRRHRDRARPRPRRDRRDHLLHEHLEPVGHARRRPPGPERGRARARGQAVGEDLAGARLEGGHGVLRAGGPGHVPRGARLPPRRLRLHDLHRQLRPAAGRDLRRGQRRGPGGRLRAVRQPQLRGPDQPRREDELPRVAAAVHRIRAGGDDGHRPARRAARAGQGRRRRLPEGHLAERRGGRANGRGGRAQRHVHVVLRRGVRGRRPLELARGAGGRPLRLVRRVDVRAPAAVLRRPAARAGADRRHRGRARAGRARRLGDHRPHLARGGDQEGLAGREVPERARGREPRLQLLRLTARQPRGDDARHVREHPPAQLHRRKGARGRYDRCSTARRCRSTTRR